MVCSSDGSKNDARMRGLRHRESGAGSLGLRAGIGNGSRVAAQGGFERADGVLVQTFGLALVTSHPNFILADRVARPA